MSRLDDDQLEALFCGHWDKTRDLIACLRLVIDATARGQHRAIVRAGAERRRSARPVVVSRLIDRARAVSQAQPILKRIAAANGVDLRIFVDRGGTKSVARVRYEAMWVLRQVADMSYPEVGLAVGGRCHSDAIRAFNVTEKRIAADPPLRARLLATARPAKKRAA